MGDIFCRMLTRYDADGCGSCSMLPRDKGGVVDHNLKVYGTKNLRVIDLSILPLEVSANTQCRSTSASSCLVADRLCIAVVYGIAEQGPSLHPYLASLAD